MIGWMIYAGMVLTLADGFIYSLKGLVLVWNGHPLRQRESGKSSYLVYFICSHFSVWKTEKEKSTLFIRKSMTIFRFVNIL